MHEPTHRNFRREIRNETGMTRMEAKEKADRYGLNVVRIAAEALRRGWMMPGAYTKSLSTPQYEYPFHSTNRETTSLGLVFLTCSVFAPAVVHRYAVPFNINDSSAYGVFREYSLQSRNRIPRHTQSRPE